MKRVLLLAVIMATGSTSFAGMDCKKDWRGVLVCTDTGYSSYGSTPYGGYQAPYRSETKRDWRGHDITTDNRGNRMACKTDWRGHYVCN